MFKDVGKKIMVLAKVLCVLDLAAGVIGFFVMLIALGENISFITALLGLVPLAAGALSSLLTWFLYGFGQMIDDIHAMRSNVYAMRNASDKDSKTAVSDDLPEL